MLCICALKVMEFNQRVAALNQNLRVGLPKIPPISPKLLPALPVIGAAAKADAKVAAAAAFNAALKAALLTARVLLAHDWLPMLCIC
ncbi:MAG TPA: hypothetical protein PLV92_09620, partial [Pirellulaceae bacterium]|nr:hypothetical protein [Pirellulaceae bacterium]